MPFLAHCQNVLKAVQSAKEKKVSPKQSAIVSIIEMDSKNSEEIDRTSVNSLEKRWTISNISGEIESVR